MQKLRTSSKEIGSPPSETGINSHSSVVNMRELAPIGLVEAVAMNEHLR